MPRRIRSIRQQTQENPYVKMQQATTRPHQTTTDRPGNQPNRNIERKKRKQNRRFKKYKKDDEQENPKIVNLSRLTLTLDHLSLLELGLSFVPTPQKTNQIHTLQNTLLFNRNIRLQYHWQGCNYTKPTLPKPITGWIPAAGACNHIDNFTNVLREKILEKPKSSKHQKSNLTENQERAMKELLDNKEIMIKPADKGGAIVILNTEDYIREAERQLSNKDHYAQTSRDTTLVRASNIRAHILQLEKRKKTPRI